MPSKERHMPVKATLNSDVKVIARKWNKVFDCFPVVLSLGLWLFSYCVKSYLITETWYKLKYFNNMNDWMFKNVFSSYNCNYFGKILICLISLPNVGMTAYWWMNCYSPTLLSHYPIGSHFNVFFSFFAVCSALCICQFNLL